MVVKCNQTAHQKETAKLIKDFFESADYDISYAGLWGKSIISRLYGLTGIKFDKPFMAEVFEGSFTTSSLLEKYPISKSQVMYIFTIREQYNSHKEKTCYEVGATRVYHHGKVYVDESIGNEKYFNVSTAPTYYTLDEYNTCIQQAIKTLVLVADRENVVGNKHRISVPEKEDDVILYIINDYDHIDHKTHRVLLVDKGNNNKHWVTLREGSGKKHYYQNSDYCKQFDKSGYCVGVFRKHLSRRLKDYSYYQSLIKLVKTDFSQELQTRYDEIIVLKNLIATSIINTTNFITLKALIFLADKITEAIKSHANIVNALKKSREIYEKCEHKTLDIGYNVFGYYVKVDKVQKDLKYLDISIMKIKTKLFDEVLQQDI